MNLDLNKLTHSKEYNQLVKVWSIIGLILTAFSLLNLFGDLRIITFSQLILRILNSYRSIVHPIIEYIDIFSLGFTPQQKDLTVILFFSFGRFSSTVLVDFLYDNLIPEFKNDLVLESSENIVSQFMYKIQFFLEKFFLSLRNPKVKKGFNIFFKFIILAIILFLVSIKSFKELEGFDDTIGILFFGVVFLPILYIIFLVSGVISRALIQYIIIIPIYVIINWLSKNKFQNSLKKHKEKFSLNSIKSDILTSLKSIWKVVIFNVTVFLIILLVLGFNFFFRFIE